MEKPQDEFVEEYTPAQKFILAILRLGAWMTAFIAMTYVMHG